MSNVSTTIPFSLSMANERGETNGFTVAESLSEFVDNAYDANAMDYILQELSIPGGPTYIIGCDLGDGAMDLLPLYGIGTSVRRKTGVTRGLKNAGHRAALGHLNPNTVYHITRHRENPRVSSLVLELHKLWSKIDAAKAAGDCDYRRIDDHIPLFLRNMPNCGFTDEIRDLLQTIITNTPPSRERKIFEDMLSNTLESYHIMIMEYTIRPTAIIDEIPHVLNSFRMSYYHALMEGRSITFASRERTIITLANAIDPLCTSPRIKGAVEIRKHGVATYLKVTLSYNDVPPSTFYMTHTPGVRVFIDARTNVNPFTSKDPQDGWETATLVDNLIVEFSVPSAKEERDQLKSIGSNIYGKVEDMRGIYLGYIDRYLGRPMYNTRLWEDKRNINAFRGRIRCMSPKTMEEYMGIQKKKHSCDFQNLHESLQMFLNWICQRVIIAKFSYTANITGHAKGDSPGVTDWKFPYFCKLMMDTKAIAESAPASDSDSDSDSKSDSEQPKQQGKKALPISHSKFIEVVQEFAATIQASNIEELMETVSNDTVAGLSTKVKHLQDIMAVLVGLGLTHEQ